MLRVAGVVRESVVDGKGLRFTVFTQGCPHHCKGCHNPQTHNQQGGYLLSVDKILTEFQKNPLLKGMTLSGGEPVLQAKELIPLVEGVKAMGKDLVLYSGYTFEELLQMDDQVQRLLDGCDYLVDGRYEEKLRDLTLHFRGSTNQRILNLPQSLKQGKAVIENW